eukprot:4427621-Pleurochrysis_carterae.AAC.1
MCACVRACARACVRVRARARSRLERCERDAADDGQQREVGDGRVEGAEEQRLTRKAQAAARAGTVRRGQSRQAAAVSWHSGLRAKVNFGRRWGVEAGNGGSSERAKGGCGHSLYGREGS